MKRPAAKELSIVINGSAESAGFSLEYLAILENIMTIGLTQKKTWLYFQIDRCEDRMVPMLIRLVKYSFTR